MDNVRIKSIAMKDWAMVPYATSQKILNCGGLCMQYCYNLLRCGIQEN